eukprot:CCRYP_018141-RA/>CCRYP_018141-RA protein AED:0.22 eAED:0.45 QI:0/0/0/1/0/0/3/0/170
MFLECRKRGQDGYLWLGRTWSCQFADADGRYLLPCPALLLLAVCTLNQSQLTKRQIHQCAVQTPHDFRRTLCQIPHRHSHHGRTSLLFLIYTHNTHLVTTQSVETDWKLHERLPPHPQLRLAIFLQRSEPVPFANHQTFNDRCLRDAKGSPQEQTIRGSGHGVLLRRWQG